MNLLLEALKKTGTSARLPNIEEKPKATDQHTSTVQPSSSEELAFKRMAGENLFESKKIPRKKSLLLYLISAIIITGATGIYLYTNILYPKLSSAQLAPPSSEIPTANTAPRLIQKPVQMTAPISLPPATHDLSPSKNRTPIIPATPAEKQKNNTETNTQTISIQNQQELDSIDSMLTAAYESYQRGDYTVAGQKYHEAHIKEPDNRDALLGLAVIAQQQGRDEVALNYYRKVILLDPLDPIAHAGISRFSSGNLANKESHLKQLISQQPDSAALYFALGNQYVEQARWADAQQAYSNALSMEPENAFFAFTLAISLDHLGQQKSAAKYYQQAIRLSPYGHAGFNRAQVQQRLIEISVIDD
jgi:tetratricopeptide (TPR) repeat protein